MDADTLGTIVLFGTLAIVDLCGPVFAWTKRDNPKWFMPAVILTVPSLSLTLVLFGLMWEVTHGE